MSDYRKPVDELPVKNESTLSLTDTLIGVDAVAEPAAFQAQLGEIAAALISSIIGPVESTANGSYIRLANGFQVCWSQRTLVYGNGDLVQETWTHPAPFSENPQTFVSIRDITYGGNLTFLSVVRANTAPSTSLLRVYRHSGNTNFAPGDNVVVNAVALGRWS